MTPELRDKFEEGCQGAIRGEDVFLDLNRVALQMRLEGLSEQEACDIIGSAKEAVTGSKYYEENSTDDAICEVLDGVVGWCSPRCYIWSPDFDAKKALSELEGAHPAPGIEQDAAGNGGPAEPSDNSGSGDGPSVS